MKATMRGSDCLFSLEPRSRRPSIKQYVCEQIPGMNTRSHQVVCHAFQGGLNRPYLVSNDLDFILKQTHSSPLNIAAFPEEHCFTYPSFHSFYLFLLLLFVVVVDCVKERIGAFIERLKTRWRGLSRGKRWFWRWMMCSRWLWIVLQRFVLDCRVDKPKKDVFQSSLCAGRRMGWDRSLCRAGFVLHFFFNKHSSDLEYICTHFRQLEGVSSWVFLWISTNQERSMNRHSEEVEAN